MPFTYQNIDGGPAAGSIAALMLRRGEIAAQQANAVANANARAAEVGGQAWAGAAQNIGQSIASIPGQIQQQKEQALRQQIGQQQLAGGAIDVKEKQKKLEDDVTMARIYQGAYGQAPSQQPGFQGPTQPGSPQAGAPAPSADGLPPGMVKGANGVVTIKPDYLTNAMAQAGMGDKIPGVLAGLTAYQEKAASLAKLQGEIAVQTRDALGSLGATVEAAGNSAPAFHLAALMAIHNGQITTEQIKPYLDQVEQNPAMVGAITKQLQSGSPKQTELNSAALTAKSRQQTADTGSTRLTLETPKIAAETQVAQNTASGTTPMTPYQTAELANRSSQLKLEAEKFAETVRHNKEGEEGATLSEPARKKLSEYFATTGLIPPLGMGKAAAAMRKQVIEGAAADFPNVTIASNAANFKANQDSLKNITGTLDTLESFSKAAGKNLDQFVSLANKIPDTGVPWANTPIRLLNDKMVGAEYAPAVNAARAVATREVARITGDPKLKGVLSDAARAEVDGLVPQDITINQLKRVIPVLLNDMSNVHTSLSEQKDAINSRIGVSGSTPAVTAPKFSVGQVVQVGGKTVKITALHPDGTFDGDEVKK